MTTIQQTFVTPELPSGLGARVEVLGEGRDLLVLPGPFGQVPREIRERLASSYRIYIPDFPGMTPGASDVIHSVWNIDDVVLYFDDVVRALGLTTPLPVYAESSGGMVGLELMAWFPERYESLLAVAPFGIWQDDLGSSNFMILPPDLLAEHMCADASRESAQEYFAWAADTKADIEATAHAIWSMGVNTRLLWPIPDRGLDRRLHRITGPVRLLWGQEDIVLNPLYADRLSSALRNSSVALIENVGHMVSLEAPDRVVQELQTLVDPMGNHE